MGGKDPAILEPSLAVSQDVIGRKLELRAEQGLESGYSSKG